MHAFLQAQAPKIAGQLIVLRERYHVAPDVAKAAPTQAELDAIEAILAGVDFAGWAALVGDVQPLLEEVVADGSYAALRALAIDVEADSSIVNVVSVDALDYAEARAAEMVGMRVDELGRLVENPDAVWQITEGTRDGLRGLVRDAVDEGWSNDRLADAIGDSYGFSDARATMIARTETNKASNAGALTGYKASGVVAGKTWLTAEDDKVSEDCEANADAGVLALDDNFPSGDDAPPAHPNAVLSGTLFVPYGELEEMVGADYAGPIVLIRTAQHFLPIGPNHPVLTRRGMVRARELREGDDLVYDVRADASPVVSDADFEQVPFVEDAFQTLISAGMQTNVAAPAHDFHGDRRFCKGEIQIVEPTRRLLPILDSCGIEQQRESGFMRADVQTVALSCDGARDLDSDAIDLASPSGVSSGLPASHFLFLQVQSIRYAPHWEGKAFDATTTTGIYNSHGFVVSNCRCAIVPVVSDETPEPVDAAETETA